MGSLMILASTRAFAYGPSPDTTLQSTILPWFHTTIMSSVATSTPANTAYGWMLQPANARLIEPSLAIAGLQYSSGTLRARIGLQAGTFVEANYLGPDAPYRFLHEAWADIQLVDDLSLKAGVFPSHIGNESMISSECRTLTRSLIADFTPYYESGVVLTWTRGIVSMSALALNGWQRIVDDNGHPAFGTQVVLSPDSITTVNWSSFVGREREADGQDRLRIHNDVWIARTFGDLHVSALCDVTVRQAIGTDVAIATNVQGRYGITDRISLAARAEYVNDPQNILFPLVGGSSILSWSAGIDVLAQSAVKLRGEVRHFTSKAKLWTGNTDGDNLVVTLGMSVDLE